MTMARGTHFGVERARWTVGGWCSRPGTKQPVFSRAPDSRESTGFVAKHQIRMGAISRIDMAPNLMSLPACLLSYRARHLSVEAEAAASADSPPIVIGLAVGLPAASVVRASLQARSWAGEPLPVGCGRAYSVGDRMLCFCRLHFCWEPCLVFASPVNRQLRRVP